MGMSCLASSNPISGLALQGFEDNFASLLHMKARIRKLGDSSSNEVGQSYPCSAFSIKERFQMVRLQEQRRKRQGTLHKSG